MDEYKCEDCFHANLCEKSKMLVGFSRGNPAYCGMFLNSADVAQIRHGRWIGSGDGYADGELVYDMWECSECSYDADGTDEKPEWNYCPNCGAKMDDE